MSNKTNDIMKLKATELSPKKIKLIIYALELAYGDCDTWNATGIKLAEHFRQAKVVITAK